MLRILLVLLLVFLINPTTAVPAFPLGPMEFELGRKSPGILETAVYVEDLETGSVFAVGADKVEFRHPPFSSFKIPNFLIALETGAAASVNETITYDAKKRPEKEFWPRDWAQDQTLGTAFKRSAAWAYQEMALKIGEAKYAGYLDHFDYGNQKAKGDGFWLDRSLEVSPKEQVDFLRKLLTEQFEVAPLNIEALEKVASVKTSEGFELYGKTGAGPVVAENFQGEFEGWYVAWLRRPMAKPVLIALWTRAENYQALREYRLQSCLDVLKQLGYLPLSW